MTNKQKLIRAAKLIANKEHFLEFTCHALNRVNASSDLFSAYRGMYSPASNKYVWFGESRFSKNQDRRVIALLLAAEVLND